MKCTSLFWPILVGTYLLGSLAASLYALFGSWMQYAFGVPHYYNWDPDGYYLAAGIQFFDGPFAAWYGHPGLPLQFMIGAIAHIMYELLTDSNRLAYPAFVAQNQYEIILVTKTAITTCYLASFYFLFKVARVLLDELEARVAVVLFASTAIVLTYANKISPEPFLLLFVLIGLYCSIQAVAREQAWRACGVICMAGVATALAMLTKLTVTFLLPVYFVVWIAAYPRITAWRKMVLAAVFTSSCLVGLVLLGQKIDWVAFFSFWNAWSPIGFEALTGKSTELSHPFSSIAKVASITSATVAVNLDVGTLFSLQTKQGQFNLAELPLTLMGVIGIFMFLETRLDKRWITYSLILLMVVLAPVVFWRGASHYRVVHLALLSIFAAYGLGLFARRSNAAIGSVRRTWAFVCCLLVFVGPSAALAISLKTGDIHAYSKGWGSIYACLSDGRHDRIVTLINVGDSAFVPGRLLGWYFDFLDQKNPYSPHLAARFSITSSSRSLPEANGSRCLIDADKLY